MIWLKLGIIDHFSTNWCIFVTHNQQGSGLRLNIYQITWLWIWCWVCVYEEKIIYSRFRIDYEFEIVEWFDCLETLLFEEVQRLLEEKDSKESFDAMRYQL